MDEDDPLTLSFSDALTCVFGASIALFLIFVVLVKLAPATVQISGLQESNAQLASSITRDVEGLSSLVLIASSTPKAGTCETSTVRSLGVENGPGQVTWDGEKRVRSGASESIRCIRVIELRDGLVGGEVSLVAVASSGEPVDFQVQVGASLWPDGPRRIATAVIPAASEAKPVRVLSINARQDGFVEFHVGGS